MGISAGDVVQELSIKNRNAERRLGKVRRLPTDEIGAMKVGNHEAVYEAVGWLESVSRGVSE